MAYPTDGTGCLRGFGFFGEQFAAGGAQSMSTHRETLPGMPEDDAIIRASEQARGVFTGEQYAQHHPEKAAQIMQLLTEGTLSQREISRVCAPVSRNIVTAFARKLASHGKIEPFKKMLRGRAGNLAALSFERAEEILTEHPDKVTAKDAAIIAGIAAEKYLLTAGEATSRVEHIEADDRDLDKLAEAIEAEFTEHAAPMSMCAGCGGGKGDEASGPAEGAADGSGQADLGGRDDVGRADV